MSTWDSQSPCKRRDGYLEKYSVGSRFTLRRNWRRRYMMSTPEGLFYYSNKDEKQKGMIPFGFDTTLYTKVDVALHPAATDPRYHYFALQFADPDSSFVKMLLLRTEDIEEKRLWCNALATMVSRAD
eukprot:TRINITY_DN11913_c0_g1_i1.p2 TRINITY_DN11913_c0_g1~~TRINITY_DN11913_c0_g1_i1.p2  ORF type:complete len:127 (+),score=43.16 TRINITY_DN11913_c0_g1_i1:213-593(+)